MLISSTLWRFSYVFPNLLAACGMSIVGLQAWGYRQRRGGNYLLIFAAGATIWAFFEAMNFIGSSSEAIYLIWMVEYIGVCVAPLAIVLFAVNYIGLGHIITRPRLLALSTIPAITLLAAWTNTWHGWIMYNVRMDFSTPFPTLSSSNGAILWIYYGYINLLVLAVIALIFWRMTEFPLQQRRQMRLILIALALPLVAAGLYMGNLNPLRNMSLIPLAFNFAGFLLIWAFKHARLFELSPVTPHEIYSSMDEPVFVLDETNRILDFNGAAKALLSLPDKEMFDCSLTTVFPGIASLLDSGREARQSEVIYYLAHYFDVRIGPINSLDRRFSGRLLVWRDITEHKRMEADLYRMAITDSLTGLYNRRYFIERGHDEIIRARRYGRPLSLFMLDIDYFKQVNDCYGHEAGDRVLIMLSGILGELFRATDCIGRMGGEEFAMLLTETDRLSAHEAGVRLMESIRNARVQLSDGNTISITASLGMATLDDTDLDFSFLMRRADKALYHAKDEGRDRMLPSRSPV